MMCGGVWACPALRPDKEKRRRIILFPGAVYEEHTDSQGGTAMAGSSLFPVLVLEVPSQLALD